MTLKEQLSEMYNAIQQASEEKKRNEEYPKPLIRTQQDWEIIEEYLKGILKNCPPNAIITVEKKFSLKIKRKYICIKCNSKYIKEPRIQIQSKEPRRIEDWYSRFVNELKEEYIEDKILATEQSNRIILSNGENLEIRNEDIQSFCDQYDMELAYLIKENGKYKFSNKYCGTFKTIAYLIDPKSILMIYEEKDEYLINLDYLTDSYRLTFRTAEDWNIINQYLKNTLIRKARKEDSFIEITIKKVLYYKIKKKCIAIKHDDVKKPLDEGMRITLSNGEYLEIYEQDIQRFCKQHDMKLVYLSHMQQIKGLPANSLVRDYGIIVE